jgi:hypothetical protein
VPRITPRAWYIRAPEYQAAKIIAQGNECWDAAGNRSAPDVVELILAEHARISEFIEKLGSALADTGPAVPRSELDLAWAPLAAFLQLHLDAAEEIAYQAWASVEPGATSAIMQEVAVDSDIRDAVQEARLSLPGSRSWHMAVEAACNAARSHIANLESAPLVRFQTHIAPKARHDLGGRWVAFMTARALDAASQLPRDLRGH